MACIRLSFEGDAQRAGFITWINTQIDALVLAHPQILAVHGLAAAREVREAMDALRPNSKQDEWPDSVLLIELGRASDFNAGLRATLSESALRLAGLQVSGVTQSTYQLMFEVTPDHHWHDQPGGYRAAEETNYL